MCHPEIEAGLMKGGSNDDTAAMDLRHEILLRRTRKIPILPTTQSKFKLATAVLVIYDVLNK